MAIQKSISGSPDWFNLGGAMFFSVPHGSLCFENLSDEQLLEFMADYLGLRCALNNALVNEVKERGRRIMFCTMCTLVVLLGSDEKPSPDWEIIDDGAPPGKQTYRHIHPS